MLQWLKLLLPLLPLFCTQSAYYITPTPDTPCPGEPCHTLSQYIDQYFNNFSANTTLLFLPGDHTLNRTVSIGTASNSWDDFQPDYYYPHPSLTLLGNFSSLPEVTSRIACTWPAGFAFSGITDLHINALAFISCGHHDAAAVRIQSVCSVDISNCIFQNNANLNGFGGAMYVHDSTLTLASNTFQHNSAYLGGALEVYTNNTLTLFGNVFQNNSAFTGGGVDVAMDSRSILTENIFVNNSADFGGALYAHTKNYLTLFNNTFQNNSANEGGALYIHINNTLTLSKNTFQNNSADRYNNNNNGSGGALFAYASNFLTISKNIFENNSADLGGALCAVFDGTLTLFMNTFQKNSADNGGAIIAYENNNLTLSENAFQNNSASGHGAVSMVRNNAVVLLMNIFQNNSAGYGAAVFALTNNTLTLLNNTFENNLAQFGGALYAFLDCTLTLFMNTFQKNSANNGGAVNAVRNIYLTLSENTFQNNSAIAGGAVEIYIDNTVVLLTNIFHNNSAFYGGAVLVLTNNVLTLLNNTFQNNSVGFGGGALYVHQSTIHLTDNNLTRNTAKLIGGAILCLRNSSLSMNGTHRLQNNTAEYGGGIAAVECHMILSGGFFESNKAKFGGGLYTDQSQVSGYSNFSNNLAKGDGGGIYASSSEFYFNLCSSFVGNSAQNGGGLLFTKDSKLHLWPNTTLNFTSNSVNQNGGAIEVVTDNPLSSCVEIPCEHSIQSDCFFQIQTERQYDISKTDISEIPELHSIRIYFTDNKAEAGADLYGGSVDNCSLSFIKSQVQANVQFYQCPESGKIFDYISNSALGISSDPQYICVCKDGQPDCRDSSFTTSVYPGGKIHIPVIAFGQRNGTTASVIKIIPQGNITIDGPESIQNITNSCTYLNYSVQSSAVQTSQEMILHIHGSCPPQERRVSSEPTNIIDINVSIRSCPHGFELLENQSACECAQRLEQFTSFCRIDDGKIERGANAEFWVGYVQDNKYDGLILHPHCPFDYCRSDKVYIAVDDSDEQCSGNRAGLLCGKCSRNFSLALGSSRCLQCSNDYLWLIVAFAFAGIILVLFLFVLRLTVAVGTINGLLLYANVFAVNSATFLQAQDTNILTVFIAWLNLDLGIETCFYNGMDAYTKTWLQFAFPLYVWALVIAVITISHYSIRISTILSNSTIEVLATLILLSYAKLLRTFIAALVYTRLDYPNDSQIAVWLYDANISYLSNKHIPLFTATMICLAFLFLPYTMFLSFGQWLRAKSRWRIFSWVNHHRILPFLEAYHAPYTDKHRYWTGLMLIVRCILFLIFAFGDSSINLLCIGCTTVMLHILTILLGNRIYKTWSLNILESFFIGNLLILVLATQYVRSINTEANQKVVTFTSLSIVFMAFIGIIIYHSVQQAKETPRWWKRMFPSHRDDYKPVTRTDKHSKPERIHSPNLSDQSDARPTVAYINVFEGVQSVELQDTACMETSLLQNARWNQ